MERAGKIDILVFDGAGGVFGPRFLDADVCRDTVLGSLHPGGFRCPSCGGKVEDARRVDRLRTGERIACAVCSKRFSALSGTRLSGTHMDFREIVFLAWMNREGIRPGRIAEIMDMDPTTVRAWCKRLEDD